MKFSGFLLVVTGLSGMAFISGCASAKRTVASAAGPDYVLTKAQYEQVEVTGSKLQTLVPTAGSVTPLPPMSPIVVMSPAAFRSVMQSGRGLTRR